MRIVSWNMRGQVIAGDQLKFMLNVIQADVCVFQEPYNRLTFAAAASRTGATTRASAHTIDVSTEEMDRVPRLKENWSITHIPGGRNSQQADRYAFACRTGFSARYTLVQSDPRDGKSIEQNYQRQYLIVKFVQGAAAHGVKVATVHAPYQASSGVAAEYVQVLLDELTTGYDRASADWPLGPAPAAKPASNPLRLVDVLIGDLNVPDRHQLNLSGNPQWSCCLHSPTSQGRYCLDRILVRAGQFPNYRCGRLFVKGDTYRTDRSDDNGRVVDFELPPRDSRYKGWQVSDHSAIYLDTDTTEAGSEAPTAIDFPDAYAERRRSEKHTGSYKHVSPWRDRIEKKYQY